MTVFDSISQFSMLYVVISSQVLLNNMPNIYIWYISTYINFMPRRLFYLNCSFTLLWT